MELAARGGLPADDRAEDRKTGGLSGDTSLFDRRDDPEMVSGVGKDRRARDTRGLFWCRGLPGARLSRRANHLGLRASGSHDVCSKMSGSRSIMRSTSACPRNGGCGFTQSTVNAIFVAAIYDGVAEDEARLADRGVFVPPASFPSGGLGGGASSFLGGVMKNRKHPTSAPSAGDDCPRVHEIVAASRTRDGRQFRLIDSFAAMRHDGVLLIASESKHRSS